MPSISNPSFPLCDLALAKRLEYAEGEACASFAEARNAAFPDLEAPSVANRIAGAFTVFDGAMSPITQSFGLGIFEEFTEDALGAMEAFFFTRGAAAAHEVCPLAGVNAIRLLCQRGYLPVEVSTVLFRPIATGDPEAVPAGITVRIVDASSAEGNDLWAQVSADGWSDELPELRDFVLELGRIFSCRPDLRRFLAEIDGEPAATGVVSLHQGVALLSGASTLPKFRRRGAQAALLSARLQYAASQGCDLAMMVAEAGSGSQRNAERRGFRIAYTRTKWLRDLPSPGIAEIP
ncbi:GNAT family acetyltransferase [Bryobacterales bacterium F-183]|nr:GNAT family acetyltransferase [Bryobacterales bacterium F-183]